jgi:hypothetical protein
MGVGAPTPVTAWDISQVEFDSGARTIADLM